MRSINSTLYASLAALSLMTAPADASTQGQVINETSKLLSSDGEQSDRFGGSVSVHGSVAVLGSCGSSLEPGSAYLFDISSTSAPVELFRLQASDAEIGDSFGCSVATDGEYALVGAYKDDDNGLDSGSVYVFDVDTGAQLSKLLPFDGESGDWFGSSVSMSGDLAVIGAMLNDERGPDAGAAYVFNIHTGLQVSKLLASDAGPGELFGNSVSIDGTKVLVGASGHNGVGSRSGAAYVFDAITGEELAKIELGDAQPGDRFGSAVAIEGDVAVIGASGRMRGIVLTGAAYLYDLNTYQQLAKLNPEDGNHTTYFGCSASISDGTAVVGAYNHPEGYIRTGAAYLFDVESGVEIAKLSASDGENHERFGEEVSIHGGVAISTAPRDDDNGSQSGSAYLFDLRAEPGTPYCSGDNSETSCPCGNVGAPGEGCANSTGAGALLGATGTASLAAEDLVLEATNLPSGPGLFFQGDNAVNGGSGDTFGDGLRCAGGGVVRLQVRFSSNGAASTSTSIAATSGATAGETKYYQFWYRDMNGSPCSNGFNLTNGYELTWTL